MSNPISGAFNNNNINSLAYIEARELAGAPSETKDQTSEKVNKLKKLFAKKEAEKLKEAETAINQYDFQEIKKTLQKIENPQASLFLLELVSTFEKIPPALNIAEFLPADSNPENETLKNLKKKLSQIPPVYLELLKKRNWKILAIKNEEDLIKSPVLETKDKDNALKQNQEILKKIRSEMPEIKLNLDPAKIESKDLHEFKERILEKIEENLDNKVFFAPKENIKNLDKLFFSEFMLKKMIRDIEDKNPEVVYLYSDSIKYIKALDDFYKLNTNYNNQHIPLKDLEFLKQFPKNYTCLTNNKHNLILANADLYNKQASSKISPLKHEIYHAIEGSLIEEAPLFFLGYILPEATKNYQMCKKYDNDPAKYGSPGVKDEQGKTHEFLGSYSALYKDEYSANTFSAYFDNEGNKILKENDPIQHTFIENLTNLLNLAKDISRKK